MSRLSLFALKDTGCACVVLIPELEAANPVSFEVSLYFSKDVLRINLDMLPRPVATLLCVNLYLVTLYSVGEAKLKTNKVAVSELVGDPTQPYNLAEAFFVLNHGIPWPRLVGMLLQVAESW